MMMMTPTVAVHSIQFGLGQASGNDFDKTNVSGLNAAAALRQPRRSFFNPNGHRCACEPSLCA
jgi:hypothetical protein